MEEEIIISFNEQHDVPGYDVEGFLVGVVKLPDLWLHTDLAVGVCQQTLY